MGAMSPSLPSKAHLELGGRGACGVIAWPGRPACRLVFGTKCQDSRSVPGRPLRARQTADLIHGPEVAWAPGTRPAAETLLPGVQVWVGARMLPPGAQPGSPVSWVTAAPVVPVPGLPSARGLSRSCGRRGLRTLHAVPLGRPSRARACGRWARCSVPRAASRAGDEGRGRLKCGPQGRAELDTVRWRAAPSPPFPLHPPSGAGACCVCGVGSASRLCHSLGLGCPQLWPWSSGHLPLHTVLDGLVWPLQAPRGRLPPPRGPLRGRALPGPRLLGKPSSEGRAAPQPGPAGPGGHVAFTPHPSPSGNSGARPARPVRSGQQGGHKPGGPRDWLSELSWGPGPQQDVEWPLDSPPVGGRGGAVAGGRALARSPGLKREDGGEGPPC